MSQPKIQRALLIVGTVMILTGGMVCSSRLFAQSIDTSAPQAASKAQADNAAAQAQPAKAATRLEKDAASKKVDAKADRSAASKKKAEDLLNRCYQEALNTQPQAQAEALTKIGQSMKRIDKERALFIFDQAFSAAFQVEDTDSSQSRMQTKTSLQFSIVTSAASVDLEKALQMALKMDRVYPTADNPSPSALNLRNNALSFIAARIAAKQPDRAFEIVEQQIAEGNYDPSFIGPVAMALRKSRPDKAEQLFVEAINQFEQPNHDMFQIRSFVDLTTRLFDLNHSLSAKAVDLIIKSAGELEKQQNDNSVSFTISTSTAKGSTTINSIREYVAVEAVAMMRRLDPERAKQLEESFAEYRDAIAKSPNGIMPIGNQMDAPTSTAQDVVTTPGGGDQSDQPAAGNGSQKTMTFAIRQVGSGGSGASQPKIDPNQMLAQLQSQMQAQNAVNEAANNPQAAINGAMQIESPTTRAKALARVAAAIYKTEPEKAKGLLSDAYATAEKISAPYDRAEIDGYVADGYALFDPDRAKAILDEAFGLAGKVMENEAQGPTSAPFDDRLPPQYRMSNRLYQQLIDSLAKLNIDDAINRASQISDPKLRLLTEISMADYILNDGITDNNEMRIVVR